MPETDDYLVPQDAYTDGFSRVYDIFMDEVPYDRWAERILRNLKRYATDDGAPERKILCDLGCGTGQMTRRMAEAGYDCIGVDLSEDMLSEAMQEEGNHPKNILYVNQDMCSLDLCGCAGQMISCCDSVNYLLTKEEMGEMLRGVSKFLLPGGLFVFDFNTLHKYRDTMGEKTIAENRTNESFVWENCFYDTVDNEEDPEHPLKNINTCSVTFYLRHGDTDLFSRSMESHWQRGWTMEEIADLLAENGFALLEAVDDETDAPPTQDAERIVITAKKTGEQT